MSDQDGGQLGLSALRARLRADIKCEEDKRDQANQQIAHLHELLENTERLEKYAAAPMNAGLILEPVIKFEGVSLTDQVVKAFRAGQDHLLSMDTIVERVLAANGGATAGSVRNAVYYAAGNGGRLEKQGRGRFALKNSSAPETTGAEAEGTA